VRYLGTVSISKHEPPDNFQNDKRRHGSLFGQVPLLWEKIKHRYSSLSSTLKAVFLIDIFLGGEKGDTI
jgi:hypothetical protein